MIGIAAGAAAGVAVLAAHRSSRPLVGPVSAPALIVLAGCGLIALAAAIGAVSSNAALHRWLLGPVRGAIEAIAAGPPRGRPAQGLVLVSLAVVAFAVVQARAWTWGAEPYPDEWDFVRLARWLDTRGGPGRLPGLIVRGAYTESNRQPLYVGLLAVHPTIEFGKALSNAFGLAAILLTSWGVACRQGPLTGGWAALLVATNSAFASSSAAALCETLVVLWVVLAWLAARRQASGSGGRALAGAALAGLCMGAAYWVKATVLLLVPVHAAWSISRVPRGRRRVGLGHAAVALGMFLIAAAPLIVRNQKVFGTPFYSFNERFFFVDSYDEGIGRPFRGAVPEAARYLREHGPLHAAGRELRGLMWEAYIIGRTLGPIPLEAGRAVVGWPLLLLGLAGIVRGRGPARGLILGWLGVAWVMFAYYTPIAAGDRFILFLVPPLSAAAAGAGLALLRRLAAGDRRTAALALLLAALWAAGWVGWTAGVAHPPHTIPRPAGWHVPGTQELSETPSRMLAMGSGRVTAAGRGSRSA